MKWTLANHGHTLTIRLDPLPGTVPLLVNLGDEMHKRVKVGSLIPDGIKIEGETAWALFLLFIYFKTLVDSGILDATKTWKEFGDIQEGIRSQRMG